MQLQHKFANALIYGTLGALAVFIAAVFLLPAWVLFLGRISYYLFGKTPGRAVNTYVLVILGIIMLMAMQISGEILLPVFGQPALLIVVSLFIGALTFIDNLKWLGNMAPYFIGMVVYFASEKDYSLNTIFEISIPLILGFGFAWRAVFFRKKAEQYILSSPS